MFLKTDGCSGHDAQHLDILTIIFPIKSFQKQLSLARFYKNNVFPYSLKALPDKMRRKYRKLKRLSKISPRFPLRTTWENKTAISKFWLFGGQRLKLHHDVDGCPLHFSPSEWPDSKFELDANKNNTSKPFLDTFRKPQMIDLWLFLLRSCCDRR